jgi:phosphate transport system permease protein
MSEHPSPRRSLLSPDPRTRRRNAAEARFRAYGQVALAIALGFLAVLLVTIVARGAPAFSQSFVTLPVTLPEGRLDPSGTRDPVALRGVTTFRYAPLLAEAMTRLVAADGIETGLTGKDMAGLLSASAAAVVRDAVLADPGLIGQTVEFRLLAASRVDGYLKGRVTRASAAQDMNISPEQLDLVDALKAAGRLGRSFNLSFVTGADASESRPEAAGFGVAMLGSFYMMLVVLILGLPIGVATAIYLEEFAPRNRWTDLIEVNISNLAAVPSIVFGILGLAVFIQVAHLPQSAPLVGGLVLSLMTLPRIIIPTRAALKAVPPSIKDAALGVGASRMQAVFHHVLPLALPGILTGVILGLAQALGETAPLMLIGMVGYVATNAPSGLADGFLSPNSAMPAQIYEWSRRADPAYYERAWGGIILLLVFMVLMNIVAILLRRRFERRW